MRRLIYAASGLAVGLLLAWMLLPRFIAPDEAAQLATAPQPEPVTAEVEIGVLREVMHTEAEVVARETVTIGASAPPGAVRVVVGGVADQGTRLTPGDAIAAVSGRPIIFTGRLIAHRNLYRGLQGRDVQMLQEMLVGLSYLVSDGYESAVFDEATEDAVALLYEGIGFVTAAPPEVVSEESLLQARNEVDQAQAAYQAARQGGDRRAQNIAFRSLEIARARLQRLEEAPRLAVPAVEMAGIGEDRAVVGMVWTRVGAVLSEGEPMLALSSEETELRARLPLARGLSVRPGQAATIYGPDGALHGTVDRVEADPSDPTLMVVVVAVDDQAFQAGTRMLVEIELRTSGDEVISVPASAVRSDGAEGFYVEVVAAEGTRRVEVQPGEMMGGRVAVDGDLAPGDLVVVGAR
jgi:hypothetical protein